MTTLSPFLSINSSCDQALQLTRNLVSQAGLSAVQTFNLNTARPGVHDCACPNHETEECDCQMIVLLVYGDSAEPATLILHGNNGKTWISLADTALQIAETRLITKIRQALEGLVAADC